MNAWQLVLILPLASFATGVAVSLLGAKRLAALLYTLGAAISFANAILRLLGVTSDVVVSLRIPLPPPFPRIHVTLFEDAVTALFIAAMSLSWLVASLSHMPYWRLEEGEPKRGYTALMGAAVASMYTLTLSRDFISLLASWELMSFALACMIAYAGEDEARKASLMYIILMHIVSLPMFVGIAASLASGAEWYTAITEKLAQYVLVAFLLAFIAKSGLVPFHFWLPPAHSRAPSDASVILSGASVKPSLLQALLALVALSGFCNVKEVAIVIAGLALLSIVVGVAGALWSREGKRVLAYSTIAYVGVAWLLAMLYVLSGNVVFLLAALITVLVHAAYKSTAFIAVGILKAIWGTDAFTRLTGLCFDRSFCRIAALAAAMMMPVPPLAHFIGDLSVLILLSSLGGSLKIYVYVAALMVVLTAIGIGLAYTRIVASLQSISGYPPKRLHKPNLILAAIIFVALAVPTAVLVAVRFYNPILTSTVMYAVLLSFAVAGAALLARTVPLASPWLSGEEAVYARRVPPASSPLAAPAPRLSIEGVFFRLKRPEIHEVGYERVYLAIARIFSRLVLRPLVAPLETGNLGLYIALILVYFIILVFVGRCVAP